MKPYPPLNLPPVKLRATRRGEQVYVWDSARGRYLLLTPEEWVRRHVIGLLTRQMDIPPLRISQEYPVVLNGMSQRADVVVMDRTGRPGLLVECKAADVEINNVAADQAFRYNSVVNAPYVMLTNGLKHYFYHTVDFVTYQVLDHMPSKEQIEGGSFAGDGE